MTVRSSSCQNSILEELHIVLITWLSGLDCSDHTTHDSRKEPMTDLVVRLKMVTMHQQLGCHSEP